jgi:SAM-dependent methyltransferase
VAEHFQSVNAYSDTWFGLFLSQPDPEQTTREVEFLSRNLPLVRFPKVLDVCCGYGRHAAPLSSAGYQVLGIDRDQAVIEGAIASAGKAGPEFVAWPMERVGELEFEPDAVICMWQSFGYFSSAVNSDILAQIAERLKPGGRLVMDIYHRDFFEARQGTRRTTAGEVEVVTTQAFVGDRLRVQLDYGNGGDVFDWQVFTPHEFITEVGRHGFRPVVACAGFDEARLPDAESPRMQFVLELA